MLRSEGPKLHQNKPFSHNKNRDQTMDYEKRHPRKLPAAFAPPNLGFNDPLKTTIYVFWQFKYNFLDSL